MNRDKFMQRRDLTLENNSSNVGNTSRAASIISRFRQAIRLGHTVSDYAIPLLNSHYEVIVNWYSGKTKLNIDELDTEARVISDDELKNTFFNLLATQSKTLLWAIWNNNTRLQELVANFDSKTKLQFLNRVVSSTTKKPNEFFIDYISKMADARVLDDCIIKINAKWLRRNQEPSDLIKIKLDLISSRRDQLLASNNVTPSTEVDSAADLPSSIASSNQNNYACSSAYITSILNRVEMESVALPEEFSENYYSAAEQLTSNTLANRESPLPFMAMPLDIEELEQRFSPR